jgi:hypothetical protein
MKVDKLHMMPKCPKQLGHLPIEEDHRYVPLFKIKPHPKNAWQSLRTHWHTQNAFETKLVHIFIKIFQRYQEHDMKCCGLGDLSVTRQNKTKQPCFIDRY